MIICFTLLLSDVFLIQYSRIRLNLILLFQIELSDSSYIQTGIDLPHIIQQGQSLFLLHIYNFSGQKRKLHDNDPHVRARLSARWIHTIWLTYEPSRYQLPYYATDHCADYSNSRTTTSQLRKFNVSASQSAISSARFDSHTFSISLFSLIVAASFPKLAAQECTWIHLTVKCHTPSTFSYSGRNSP